MVFAKLNRLLLVLLCLAAQSGLAGLSAEIADLAARIDYGFYAEEQRVIEAAHQTLERLDDRDSSVRYYRALGAFRLAQLRLRTGEDIRALLDDCAEQAAPADQRSDAAAEGWILVAACASLGVRSEPMRASVYQRRRDQALEHARQLDPVNPRIALVEAWSVGGPPTREALVSEEAAASLERVVAGFRSRPAGDERPQWGEAEALAQLGEIYLRRGDARGARDLIERALLIAPDYRFALSLQDLLRARR